jgi:hypothetical protein
MVVSVLGSLLLAGCVSGQPQRAIGIPGAASRTPDLTLPLSPEGYDYALLYLDNKRPPLGLWDRWDKDEIAEERQIVTPDTRRQFQSILELLQQTLPRTSDLTAGGKVGALFVPPGASDEALDTRFQGQIVTGDIRVGILHGYYFVFYRRYPQPPEKDVACEKAAGEDQYCRLVIVKEVATRKE